MANKLASDFLNVSTCLKAIVSRPVFAWLVSGRFVIYFVIVLLRLSQRKAYPASVTVLIASKIAGQDIWFQIVQSYR